MNMDSIVKAMEPVADFAGKLGSQRHLSSLRDGFVTTMPLIVTGSVAILINQLPGVFNGIFHTGLSWPSFISSVNGLVWSGTTAVITLLIVLSVSYHLARSYDANAFAAAFVSLACFMGIAAGNTAYFGVNHLFSGILISLCSTEVFIRLAKVRFLQIKLPDSVPPAVGKSFSALFPGLLSVYIFALFGQLVLAAAGKDLFTLLFDAFTPLVYAADSLGSAILIVFLTLFLWVFGLHGSNIVGAVWEPVGNGLVIANTEALQAGQAIPHIVSKTFLDVFVWIGGSGATLGMIIAIFMISRSKYLRTIGKACIAPGLFQINEPIVFGFPIVLNPLVFIPFILGPIITTVLSYFATYIGLVNRVCISVPWSTPPLINAFLSTNGDWRAIILQAVNLAVIILIYLPFVAAADRLELAKEKSRQRKGDS